MFPLHYVCYHNMLLWDIQFFVRLWCEAMKEVVQISDTSTGVSGDWTSLELTCDANAPLEVIDYLAHATCHVSLDITNWAVSILMERNQSIEVVRSVFGEWDQLQIHVPFPKKQNIKQAYYHLHNNDWDLVHVSIGWPLPRESALEALVEAISFNNTVPRLDIRDGDKNFLPGPWPWLNKDPWWDGREEVITELLKSALENNTSIKEIHLKNVYAIYINQFVDIAKHSQQLETVHFNGNGITKEMASYIMMQLAIKRLVCNVRLQRKLHKFLWTH